MRQHKLVDCSRCRFDTEKIWRITAPESCVAHREVRDEALTGCTGRGQPLSCEIMRTGCRRSYLSRKATRSMTIIASHVSIQRSRKSCACREAIYAETGRSWRCPEKFFRVDGEGHRPQVRRRSINLTRYWPLTRVISPSGCCLRGYAPPTVQFGN